nr:PREDICTED: dnaJ homolog subfamily C member 10-like [Bemisia tabaci]
MYSAQNFIMRLLLIFVLVFCLGVKASSENYYEILGVAKYADNLEIRKAFKKLAVKLHPDKNQDDPDAHATFIKLTRAYEVLKDPTLRKNYDKFGDEKPTEVPKYHSWSYYSDDFGLYDDNPEIVTLSTSDFKVNVARFESQWFIKFYSPRCSHCHYLAPTWRKLAKELKGVIKFGAVNCEEEWNLCRQEGILSYPTLMLYPSRIQYNGDRDKDTLVKFILNHVETKIIHINYPDDWMADVQESNSKLWMFLLCNSEKYPACIQSDERIKLAAMLASFVGFGVVDCREAEDICETLSNHENSSSVVFWNKAEKSGTLISSNEPEEITKIVLDLLPPVPSLNADTVESITEQLKEETSSPWLLIFTIQYDEKLDLELKALPSLLPNINVGKVHCAQMNTFCRNLFIMRYPEFIVFKPGGGHEFYHGHHFAYDIAMFAQEAVKAKNFRAISYEEFHESVVTQKPDSKSSPWVVDFYAPWCPPCLSLLPQLREASIRVANVNFGVVDCTVHHQLCSEQNIGSYPTTIFFFNGTRNNYKGPQSPDEIVEFLNDIQNPIVIKLTEETFYRSVGRKPKDAIWVVDFFMPWCGPCQQLAPQFRKLAKLVSGIPNIFLASVNCEEEGELCRQQGIRSYPHIRLYPLASEGLSSFAIFSGHQRNVLTLRVWLLSFLPSVVEDLDPNSFPAKVVDSNDLWLIDFYAPWCSHCHSFEPEFSTVAQKLSSHVKFGKINCDAFHNLCRNAGVSGYPTVQFYHAQGNRGYKGMEIMSQKGNIIEEAVRSVLERQGKIIAHDEL